MLRRAMKLACVAASIIAAGLLPAQATGCGRNACITFGKAAYDKAGACPSMDEASHRLGGDCFGTQATGEGVFDGDLCCYPIVEDNTGECFGGFGGGFGGSGGFGGGSCASCLVAFETGGLDPSSICADALTPLDTLRTCACSTCATYCGSNACMGLLPEPACNSCIEGGLFDVPDGCTLERSDCASH